MNDVTTHRLTGSLCSTSHKRPMVWDGHLCRGANLTPPNDDNFCLWTLCGRHDVPANAAEEASVDDVACVSCAAIFDGEPGTAFRGSAMSETTPTPTPWATNGKRVENRDEHGVVNDGWIICDCDGPDAEANAALIVTAVNAHAQLTHIVRSMLSILETVDPATGSSITFNNKAQMMYAMRAALRLAEGEK